MPWGITVHAWARWSPALFDLTCIPQAEMMNTLKIYLFRILGKQNSQIYPCRLADFGIFSYAFGLGALLCFFFAVAPRCRGQSLRTDDSDASPWLGKSALESVGACRDACPSTWPWP
jgi:hypothetical protein